MEYLYHRVPKNMSGTVLYPLNTLKQNYPEIYAQQVKKYDNRQQLLTTEVPPLHCLWNDVLHFTAVSPEELAINLAKADIRYEPQSWFKVPISMVEGVNSISFTYRRDNGVLTNFRVYEKFDSDQMAVYRTVPDETIEYYKQKKAEESKPLLFYGVPHILYKGSIQTKDLEIVTV